MVSDEAKALESTAISHLREGVRAVAAYHPASTVALSGIALLAFAPTRRLLYRMTLARFRSEEGAFRSAEVRLKALQDGATQSAMEARKLEERLAAAQQEYARGLSKLKGTGQQLLALSRGLRAMERNTDGMEARYRFHVAPPMHRVQPSIAGGPAPIAKQGGAAVEERRCSSGCHGQAAASERGATCQHAAEAGARVVHMLI